MYQILLVSWIHKGTYICMYMYNYKYFTSHLQLVYISYVYCTCTIGSWVSEVYDCVVL